MNGFFITALMAVLASGPIVAVCVGARPCKTESGICTDDTIEIPRITAKTDSDVY
jgi:hypothetical protein